MNQPLDLDLALAVPGLAQERARERSEAGLRIRGQCDHYSLVPVVRLRTQSKFATRPLNS